MGEVLLPLGVEKLSYATELLMLFNGALILHFLRISLMFGVQLSVTIGVTYKIVDTAEHTHTHPFNGPLSGTTQVSRYQKGKTNLDFIAARDSEWQWHQLAICKSAPRSRQITTPAPHYSSFFTGRMPFLPPNQQCQSTEGTVLYMMYC